MFTEGLGADVSVTQEGEPTTVAWYSDNAEEGTCEPTSELKEAP